MVDTVAFLVDHVMPDAAPVGQWVLSVPYRVQFVCGHDPAVLSAVRRIRKWSADEVLWGAIVVG